MEEGSLMKMKEWFKRLEEKQKRVAFCKLGKERLSKNRECSTDKDSHHGESSFNGAVGEETGLWPI